MSASDPRTQESELQVQKIINLQHIANNLPDAFTDYKGVVNSHNPAKNVPEKRGIGDDQNHSTPVQNKRGRSTVTNQDKRKQSK